MVLLVRAAGLPARAVRGGGQGRQARLHGEARGHRRPGRAPRPGRQRGGQEEGPGRGRRPSPAPRSEAQGSHQADPRRRDRRRSSSCGSTSIRAASGSGRASPSQTEMQYQVRNWYYFTWLSGDHIVEQHVHDIDVANWIAKGASRGGQRHGRAPGPHRQGLRRDLRPSLGRVRVCRRRRRCFSFCRHIPGCWDSFSEHAHGTKGFADIEGHGRAILYVDGQKPQKWERGPDGHQLEMDDLFAALAAGQPYNEADSAAESTMTAILGRMATYSGQVVQLGRGDQLANRSGAGRARLGRAAQGPAGPRRALPLRRAGRDQGGLSSERPRSRLAFAAHESGRLAASDATCSLAGEGTVERALAGRAAANEQWALTSAREL